MSARRAAPSADPAPLEHTPGRSCMPAQRGALVRAGIREWCSTDRSVTETARTPDTPQADGCAFTHLSHSPTLEIEWNSCEDAVDHTSSARMRGRR